MRIMCFRGRNNSQLGFTSAKPSSYCFMCFFDDCKDLLLIESSPTPQLTQVCATELLFSQKIFYKLNRPIYYIVKREIL